MTGGETARFRFLGGAMENKRLEDNVAPTAEMQLGELTQVKQLVVDADLGGRSTLDFHGKVMLQCRPGVGVVPAVVRIAAAVCTALRRVQRHRGTLDPSGDRRCFSRSSRFLRASARRATMSRCSTGSLPLVAAFAGGYLLSVLPRAGDAAGGADRSST